MKKNDIVFTISIPTFNRGRRAYELVENIINKIEDNWEILVLNNASTIEKEYYKKIKQLSKTKKNLRYIKHEANKMYPGNYIASIENAKGDFAMVLSDEDIPNIKNLKKELPKLNKNIGILRGSIKAIDGINRGNSVLLEDRYFLAGKEAIMEYGPSNNYMSGTVYNAKQILKTDILDRVKKNLYYNESYVHLYFEVLVCALFDVKLIKKSLSFEGKPVEETKDENNTTIGDSSSYKSPYTVGSRFDQFIALRDDLYEAVSLIDKNIFDYDTFLNSFLKLVYKYFRLIRINMPLYLKYELDEEYIKKSFYYFVCASINNFEPLKNIKEKVCEWVEQMYNWSLQGKI